MSATPPVVLTIAGSDSGGGAGIQADLKTFAAVGVFGTCAITAVTAQNSAEVRLVHALPVDVVRAQIEAVLDDFDVRAVKTGMLANASIVELVGDLAADGRLPSLVVDPVLVSSTGTPLLDDVAVKLYVQRLLPAATVFTPNRLEAETLLGRAIGSVDEQRQAARDLVASAGGAVVVKGGHGTPDGNQACDVLVDSGWLDHVLRRPRVDTTNTHGSGCSFASAIAAWLALDEPVERAITMANLFVHAAIEAGADWELGSGHGPLDHFFKYRQREEPPA